MLRNFLYLDTSAVDDYLSTLEGYVLTGSIEQTEINRTNKKGGVDFKILNAEAGGEREVQRKTNLGTTDAAKFNSLYELMQGNSFIQFVDTIDESIWNKIKRGDILEISSQINLPEVIKLMNAAGGMESLLKLMDSFGHADMKTAEMQQIMGALPLLKNHIDSNGIPIKFITTSNIEYAFTSKLSSAYIKKSVDSLEGEVTFLGKVQRLIPKGEEAEVYSLIPPVLSNSELINKNQIDRENQYKELKESKLIEVLPGPAMVLFPIAIYR